MSRYLISAFEQALWSVLNLGVNLLLIRLVAPAHYGAFAFWANCGFVLSSLQNALTVCHMQVLVPGDGLSEPRLSVERLMHVVTIIFLIVVAAATAVSVLLLKHAGSAVAAPAAILFLPAFLLQQYIRALAFTRGRPLTAAIQTGLVLITAVGLLGLTYLNRDLTANTVLSCLAAAYGFVGLTGGAWATRRQLNGLTWRALGRFRHYVKQSSWIFLGVTSTEILTRFYAFVVVGWYGPSALASLAATQQLLRPVPLLATSWNMVARADLARRREASDWIGFKRIILLTIVGGGVIAVIWTSLIYGGWGVITAALFGGKYAGERVMVLLWGAAAAIGFGQVAVSAGLQALHDFKALALANAAASVVAAGAILIIMKTQGYRGAIVGTALGQLLELVVMALLLTQALRARRAPSAA